jgi:hypothetical protein
MYISQASKLHSPRQTVKQYLGAFISANNPTPLRDAFLSPRPWFRFLKTHVTSKEGEEEEGEEGEGEEGEGEEGEGEEGEEEGEEEKEWN